MACNGHRLHGVVFEHIAQVDATAVALVVFGLDVCVLVPGEPPAGIRGGDHVVVLFFHGVGLRWPAETLEDATR